MMSSHGDDPHLDHDQPAKKRAKYTQVACNECKRRKLKCTGERVCSRCARSGIDCIYMPAMFSSTPIVELARNDTISSRFRALDEKVEVLQSEMGALSARIKELESSGSPASQALKSTNSASTAGLDRIMRPPKSPTYVGPTSAEFGLIAAGPRRGSPNDSEASDGELWTSESMESRVQTPASGERSSMTANRLLALGKSEALQLMQVYEDTVDIMYPCVDLASVRSYIVDYYEIRSGQATVVNEKMALSDRSSDQDWFFARDEQVLKIILAIALLAQSHGRSERAAELADSVEDKFATRLKIAAVDMKELLILALLSIFHSYRDDEVIAWRFVRMSIGGAMELGLHRQETWLRTGGVFPGELQWTWASKLWWCLYVLDRKWSFGTGLPLSIQDSDMDTDLPEPGASSPFLTCMISYARLGSKIWNLVVGWYSRPQSATADTCAYLDFQIQQWIQSIPPELRFDRNWQQTSEKRDTENVMTQQVLLALQANQLRLLVYRQNLLSADSIEANMLGASTAVETAKSTVQMLDHFSRLCDRYSQRPEPFNYFLISALAALFLAVLHAPTRFSQSCRSEFDTAVNMVRRSSTRARTSRRLQKIIRSLKLIHLNVRSRRHTTRSAQIPGEASGNLNADVTAVPGYSQASGFDHSTAPHVQARQLSQSELPQLQSSELNASDGRQYLNWPSFTSPELDNTSCDDLTSFFEIAGGYFLNAGPVAEMTSAVNNSLMEDHESGYLRTLNLLRVENETLTKVMAGLI